MSYAFTLAGQPLRALPARALWAPGLRLLAVSDLHLGKAERIARREGRLTPPYETEETLARLGDLVSAFRPATVICLGDSFDDDRAAEALSPAHRAALSGLMAGRRWIWIAGNHDPAPPELGGAQVAQHREAGLVFRHEAALRLGPGEGGEVSGHYHPKARIAGRALPAFLIDEARAILPAFGLYTGGLDVADAAFDPLASPSAQALALSRQVTPVPRAALVAAARRRRAGVSGEALVIGSGPAGLMAAEAMAEAGLKVIVAEAKPSPARKFLMAGKSGLNLTKAEAPEAFLAAYEEAEGWLRPMLAEFGPEAAMRWAEGLGQQVFTGPTGRVFPVAMKASPLLRAWLARLEARGVTLRRRWRWTGWEGAALSFETPEGEARLRPAVTILALGGASWARLGSDGAWAPLLAAKGVEITPFRPANMGLSVEWSAHMAPFLGAPLKAVALHAGGRTSRGEVAISARGIEGGGLYALSRPLREGAALTLDLLPDLSEAEAARRLSRVKPGASVSEALRRALALPPVKRALLMECARPLPRDPAALARLAKALPLPHRGPRPMDEAISTAGGVALAALDEGLMLRALPGVFAAGEMLDWEAPTGGYLLTACLATGLRAGRAAARFAGAITP